MNFINKFKALLLILLLCTDSNTYAGWIIPKETSEGIRDIGAYVRDHGTNLTAGIQQAGDGLVKLGDFAKNNGDTVAIGIGKAGDALEIMSGDEYKKSLARAMSEAMSESIDKNQHAIIRGLGEEATKVINELKPQLMEVQRDFTQKIDKKWEKVENRWEQFKKEFPAFLLGSMGIIISAVIIIRYVQRVFDKNLELREIRLERPESRVKVWGKKLLGISPTNRLSEIKLQTNTQQEISRFFQDLQESAKQGNPLPSLILYGPPGTGKTELAKRLASDYNFVLVTGSSFSREKDNKGVNALTELFQWAANPWLVRDVMDQRKIIIVIDEADGLLGKDTRLRTHLQALMQERSDRFAVIATLNTIENIKDPIWRRFSYKINIDKPDTSTRKEIFKLYVEMYLAKDKEVRKSLEVRKIYDQLAEQSEGLTGADIKEIVYRSLVRATSNNEGFSVKMLLESIGDVRRKVDKG